jgi:hypothetical protein
VTVPPAVDVTLASAAESDTDPPTVILDDDRVVEIAIPVVGFTVRGSHVLVAAILLVSPE